MKAYFDNKGVIHIEPENNAELFAAIYNSQNYNKVDGVIISLGVTDNNHNRIYDYDKEIK